MDGSVYVTKAPLDAEVPTLGLYGLNFPGDAISILAEDGVPEELLVYLQGKCREAFDEIPLTWSQESGRRVLTYLYTQMRDLVSQGWLRRSMVDPVNWVFDEPALRGP